MPARIPPRASSARRASIARMMALSFRVLRVASLSPFPSLSASLSASLSLCLSLCLPLCYLTILFQPLSSPFRSLSFPPPSPLLPPPSSRLPPPASRLSPPSPPHPCRLNDSSGQRRPVCMHDRLSSAARRFLRAMPRKQVCMTNRVCSFVPCRSAQSLSLCVSHVCGVCACAISLSSVSA